MKNRSDDPSHQERSRSHRTAFRTQHNVLYIIYKKFEHSNIKIVCKKKRGGGGGTQGVGNGALSIYLFYFNSSICKRVE